MPPQQEAMLTCLAVASTDCAAAIQPEGNMKGLMAGSLHRSPAMQ